MYLNSVSPGIRSLSSSQLKRKCQNVGTSDMEETLLASRGSSRLPLHIPKNSKSGVASFMSLVPGTSNGDRAFMCFGKRLSPKDLQEGENNSPAIFDIPKILIEMLYPHPPPRLHTQPPNHLKLQVSLLIIIKRNTRCVSTNHLILTRGCGKGTRNFTPTASSSWTPSQATFPSTPSS